jgi:hypothetical protein
MRPLDETRSAGSGLPPFLPRTRSLRSRIARLPLGDAIETFIRREDAERFIEEVRSDEPELATYVRIEERELEAGGLNLTIRR